MVKQGLLDTVQDDGRYGFQHLGINAGGSMDLWSYFDSVSGRMFGAGNDFGAILLSDARPHDAVGAGSRSHGFSRDSRWPQAHIHEAG